MWHRDLLKELARKLPRWRWHHKLTHRGGWLEGTSQKDRVRIELTHGFDRWNAGFYRQLRKPKKWALVNEVTTTDLDGLVSNIKQFCDKG